MQIIHGGKSSQLQALVEILWKTFIFAPFVLHPLLTYVILYLLLLPAKRF